MEAEKIEQIKEIVLSSFASDLLLDIIRDAEIIAAEHDQPGQTIRRFRAEAARKMSPEASLAAALFAEVRPLFSQAEALDYIKALRLAGLLSCSDPRYAEAIRIIANAERRLFIWAD